MNFKMANYMSGSIGTFNIKREEKREKERKREKVMKTEKQRKERKRKKSISDNF